MRYDDPIIDLDVDVSADPVTGELPIVDDRRGSARAQVIRRLRRPWPRWVIVVVTAAVSVTVTVAVMSARSSGEAAGLPADDASPSPGAVNPVDDFDGPTVGELTEAARDLLPAGPYEAKGETGGIATVNTDSGVLQPGEYEIMMTCATSPEGVVIPFEFYGDSDDDFLEFETACTEDVAWFPITLTAECAEPVVQTYWVDTSIPVGYVYAIIAR